MSSAITIPLPIPSGGEPIKEFHRFPDLPPEIRIRIWQMAYDAIPDTLVYRFRLEFSSIPDSELSDDEEETEVPQAFFAPLKEVKYLTREVRSLRKVNRESRYEGESLFDGCLRLNQTEQGGTTDLCPPINLPWKGNRSVFCFVGLNEFDLVCLEQASWVFIAQVFSTVRLLGLGLDRESEDGITADGDYHEFAEFILLFQEIHEVALVSDRLMSEADLDYIDDDIRSSFTLSCWDDWVGRVHEDVIGSHCHEPKIVTKDEHLEAMEVFAGSMFHYGEIHSESASMLLEIVFGMIFRTKEDYGYLLLDDETMEELLGEDMLSDTFSDEMPSLLSERGEDD
ncbi:hypothetical protein INS49_002837 [Diaporthe citri]|uniref:uncharacterized protein n=1 Tax=Diaporthe citri TaxID=83186 RepID=UPI001C80A897|nr:uncharacterized protein INS49_002837 [Diaporthe citri]KAG6368624.1 hypothetical protein INS49_002837 [Diaporthe citri]